MMEDGTLPAVRVGGSVRVPRRALIKCIEDNTHPERGWRLPTITTDFVLRSRCYARFRASRPPRNARVMS
jgi:hypothetical protein